MLKKRDTGRNAVGGPPTPFLRRIGIILVLPIRISRIFGSPVTVIITGRYVEALMRYAETGRVWHL